MDAAGAYYRPFNDGRTRRVVTRGYRRQLTLARRPRPYCEFHVTGLDRNEADALLVAAGPGNMPEHALISLLSLNRLHVSEVIGTDSEALGVERVHRTLRSPGGAARSSRPRWRCGLSAPSIQERRTLRPANGWQAATPGKPVTCVRAGGQLITFRDDSAVTAHQLMPAIGQVSVTISRRQVRAFPANRPSMLRRLAGSSRSITRSIRRL